MPEAARMAVLEHVKTNRGNEAGRPERLASIGPRGWPRGSRVRRVSVRICAIALAGFEEELIGERSDPRA